MLKDAEGKPCVCKNYHSSENGIGNEKTVQGLCKQANSYLAQIGCKFVMEQINAR